jgi:hypothetical protein
MNINYPAEIKPADSQVQVWYLSTEPAGRTQHVPCCLLRRCFLTENRTSLTATYNRLFNANSRHCQQ